MHRPPAIKDIVRIPGSEKPEIVTDLDAKHIMLRDVRGDGERIVARPSTCRIRLVGHAAKARARRCSLPQVPAPGCAVESVE